MRLRSPFAGQRHIVAAALSLAVVLSPPAAGQGLPRARPEEVGLSSAALERIIPGLRAYVDSGKVPGVVVAIARHGKLAYLDSVGFMDVEHRQPMRTDAVFRIYSMTKPVTAVAVMQLVERGKLALDDPVSRYIPAFANVRMYAGGGATSPQLQPAARPITIANLLTHTAGLTYGAFGETAVDSIYRRANLLDPSRDLAHFADTIAALPLLFESGSKWNYSFAMDVAGRVVEVVSHKPLDRYIHDEILVPLGMRSTGFHATRAMREHLARLYVADRSGRLQRTEPLLTREYTDSGRIYFGGAGLLSTVGDYLRFAQMLLNGGELDGHRILAKKTVALMMQNHLAPALTPLAPVGGWPLGDYGFGYGGAVRIDSSARVPGSPGTFRWAGYGSTFFWIDPRADLVAMVWSQRIPNLTIMDLDNSFQRLVYAALAGQQSASARPPFGPSASARR